MWSVCKKELRQFFSSLTGYIAIIVFLLVNGLMLFVFDNNILDFGYATLDRFFQLAPWVFLLLIPAITMRSFAEEFKTGTFEILQTRPLSRWQIVFGKYFGSLVVVIIALLPTLIYYFTIQKLSAGGGIDTGATTGSYFGLLFLAAVFTAIGICASSFTNNAVIAFIISIVACALFYYGFSAISLLPALRGNGDYYLEMIGIDFHYRSISRGVVDTRDLVYFLSIILLFLAITNRNLFTSPPARHYKVESGDKKVRSIFDRIWSSKFWGLFLLVIIVAVNFIASSFHTRFDLTKEKRYTLSKATKNLLKNLDEPVFVNVFLKGDFHAGFRKLSIATSELLKEFKESGKGNLIYNFYEPDDMMSADRKYADTLLSMGATPINLTVQVKAGEQQQYLFPVAWIRYKDKSTLVNIYTGNKRIITQDELNSAEALMEYQFINAINRIIQEGPALIGYAVGNGEPQTQNPEVYDLVEGVLRPNYNVFTLNLAAQPFIPDTFKVLLIVKPTMTFTDEEKLKLDQYVMRGGRIFWMIDDLAAEMDSLKLNAKTVAYERDLNLTDLLFRYGARINPDLIMDLQCDFLALIAGGSQENPQYEFLRWNYFPLFESRNNHPINKNLRLVASRFVNPIDTVKAEGIKKTFLLQSSPNSRKIGTPAIVSLDENRNAPEDANFRSDGIPAAVLLEGKFRSMFEGRVSKAQSDSLNARGTPFIGRSDIQNKMIIVADGDIALNDFSLQQQQVLPMGLNKYTLGTNYEYQFANRDFVLNCLEYLMNDGGIMETRNKDFVLRVLDTKKVGAQKLMWQIINIAIPILLVILFGFVYQQIRKRKYAV